MGTFLVGGILLVIVVIALVQSISHMKGEGGCCGGGSEVKPEKKKLEGPVVSKKILSIEGMHCENCKNSVEKQINCIEGAVAKVNLRKKQAVVTMDRVIPQEQLIKAVESVDFKVTGVKEVHGKGKE